MDAAHRTAGQTAAQFLIELPDIFRCKPGQLFITQTGADVILDVAAAVADVLAELCGSLFLCRSVDAVGDGVAVFLVPHHDAALPAAVVPFPHHAVTDGLCFAIIHLPF